MGDSTNRDFLIAEADWLQDRTKLLEVRHEVFVFEQKVPIEIEVDELDPESIHVLAVDSNQKPIGTARLVPGGKIGRVAVLKEWRKRQVGLKMMNFLIEKARSNGIAEIVIHAQTRTIGFYERIGFECEGAEFMEAGIAHFAMRISLTKKNGSQY